MKIPLKRSCFKRLLCIALSVVMMTGFVPMEAKAVSFGSKYSVISLKQNTYIYKKYLEAQNWVINYQLYKINVPANGYIKIQGNRDLENVVIFRTLNKNKDIDHQNGATAQNNVGKTYYQAVKKGTYYLYIHGESRFKWSLVKSKTYDQQKNYCRAKAATLAKGKKYTVFFNYSYDFPRWYKITLTKKQRITFSFKFLDNWGDYSVRMTDSRGVDVDPGFGSFYHGNYWGKPPKEKTKALPSGTYYLRLEREEGAQDDNQGRVCQISWN